MVKRCTKASKKIAGKTPKHPARATHVAATDDERYYEYVARSDLEDFDDDDISFERQIRHTFWRKGPGL